MKEPTLVVKIPELILTPLIHHHTKSNRHIKQVWKDGPEELALYFERPSSYLPGRYSAHQAPAVVYTSGLPVWPICHYLYKRMYSKRTGSSLPFSTQNDLAKARHLSFYANWCLEENIDLFKFDFLLDEEKPVHQFREYLLSSLANPDSSVSYTSASSTMSTVIMFYRWCQEFGYVSPYASMWEDEHKSLRISSKDGRSLIKDVASSKLSIRVPRKSRYKLPTPNRVNDDGESLRPLDKTEQEILFQALSEIDNFQYSLIFVTALVTGMRKQAILTLREDSIELLVQQILNGAPEAALAIGGNELVNNKKNKSCIVYFPKDLVLALKTFKNSESRQSRVNLTQNLGYNFTNNGHQHIFITQQGRPMYTGLDNPHRSKGDIKGDALNSFVTQAIRPTLKKYGFNQHFIFHDLRATFARNFLTENYDPEIHDKHTRDKMLTILKTKMGHNSISTTEKYLDSTTHYNIIKSANHEYSKLLIGKG